MTEDNERRGDHLLALEDEKHSLVACQVQIIEQ